MDDDGPFAGMADDQVLAIAQQHLRAETALPPRSLARISAGQQFDRAMAELDRRAVKFAVARIEALHNRADT